MNRSTVFALALFVATPLWAADAKSDVSAAIKSLSGKANYSWKSTVAAPEGSSRLRMGPTEGKAESGGLTYVCTEMGENKVEAVIQGEKSAVKTPDGWQNPADMTGGGQGPGRGMGMFTRNFRAPVAQATDLLEAAKDLKKEGDAYVGSLSEDGVKKLLTFRRGATGGGEGPSVADPKGSVKFWVKDGVLAKYEFHVEGKVTFNNNERDVNRTTTVELKDIGTTKVEVPEEAKKKLS